MPHAPASGAAAAADDDAAADAADAAAARMSSRSASTRNAYVYAEDTDEEDLDKIKGICGDVFEASPTGGSLYGELAKRIRTLLDKEMGVRGWNVVVGRSFGAYLTQRVLLEKESDAMLEGDAEGEARARAGRACRAVEVLCGLGEAGQCGCGLQRAGAAAARRRAASRVAARQPLRFSSLPCSAKLLAALLRAALRARACRPRAAATPAPARFESQRF